MIAYDDMELFLQDTVPKNLIITDGVLTLTASGYSVTGQTITITNDLLELEQFSLSQKLSSEKELVFGSCNAAKCEFVVHDNVPTLKGKVLKVYMYLDRDTSTMLQLGVFKVFSDTLVADKTARTIVAYDALYDILNADVTAWYNTLLPNSNSTTTVSAMRASLFSHFGVSVVSTTLINDSMSVSKTITADKISGSMVIRAICELNGVFGTIDHEGKFKFIELTAGIDDGLFPSDTLYPANDLYPQDVNQSVVPLAKNLYYSANFEDYNAEAITKLTIYNGGTGSVSVGTDGNTYTIEDNFLLYDKTSAQLTSIGNNTLSKMIKRYYKPCSVKCIGNPCHELGDPIRISTTYRGVVTYILERNLSGIQALKDEYRAQGVQKYDENLNSISSQISRVSGTVASLKVDTDGIRSDVTDLATRTSSQISQLSGEISFKVSVGDIMSGLASETAYSAIKINPSAIQVTSSGTFTVDSSNFKLTSSGYCEMGNCMIKGGTVALGTPGSTQLWIDLDRGFQMSDGSNITYLQNGYLSITAYHAYGYRILRFDNNGLTLSDNAVVTVSEFNVSNGGVGASKTQRSVYWRKVSRLADDEYVLCGA